MSMGCWESHRKRHRIKLVDFDVDEDETDQKWRDAADASVGDLTRFSHGSRDPPTKFETLLSLTLLNFTIFTK